MNKEQMQMTVLANCTPEQAEAYTLHVEIVAAAQQAATSLLDLGRKLKKMRDGGHYKALGYDTFAEYTEQEVGIRQRQAYNYITVVEKVPAQLVEENAAAGITKLALLAKMAEEMTKYTQYSVLVQAGTSMLAQANNQPQTILQLLQG